MAGIMRGNSSTVVPKSLHAKAYLARRMNPVMGEKERMADAEGDGILKLHQCLTMICVRKVKKEVVACHISRPDSDGGRTTLHMCKNDNWGPEGRQHVHGLLECLGKMRKEFTIQSMYSPGCQQLRKEIQDKIYSYCKERLQQKITSLLAAIDTGVKNTLKKPAKVLFPDDVKWYLWIKKVKILCDNLENLAKDLQSEMKSGDEKSNSCRQWIDQARGATFEFQILKEKAPKIYRCIQKVACYCNSMDVLVNWALGTDKCLKAFPVPEEPIFSPSVEEPPPAAIGKDWKAIARTHYGDKVTKQNLKHVEQRNPFLQRQVAEDPPKSLCLHAEMHIVDSLAKSCKKLGKQKQYIGVSKLCCYLCYNCIRIRNQRGSNIIVQGTHNKIYCAWRIPKSVTEEELELLEEELDRVNLQRLITYKEEDWHRSEESVPFSISPRFKGCGHRRKQMHRKSGKGQKKNCK